MDRRKFLLGSVSTAALGALGKPAPTPFVEGMKSITIINPGSGYKPPLYARSEGSMKIYCNKWIHDQLSLSERRAWNTVEVGMIPNA